MYWRSLIQFSYSSQVLDLSDTMPYCTLAPGIKQQSRSATYMRRIYAPTKNNTRTAQPRLLAVYTSQSNVSPELIVGAFEF